MKYILSVLALLFSTYSFSQTRLLPVECGNLEELSVAMVSVDEKPYAIAETQRLLNNGKTVQSIVLFFLNKKTQTWTVVEKISDNLYCIVSAGRKFNIVEDTPT